MTNEELIAALEAADGPSRELDAEVARLTQFLSPTEVDDCVDNFAIEHFVECPTYGILPYFTSSIDAALMLVPTQISGRNVFPQISKVTADRWDCHLGAPGPKAQGVLGSAATPALAIVIAAIKAGGEES